MKSLLRASALSVLAASFLFIAAPGATATETGEPSGGTGTTGEYEFKFTGGSSTTTTTTVGGVVITVVQRTINCSATGNDCKFTGTEFVPKIP